MRLDDELHGIIDDNLLFKELLLLLLHSELKGLRCKLVLSEFSHFERIDLTCKDLESQVIVIIVS